MGHPVNVCLTRSFCHSFKRSKLEDHPGKIKAVSWVYNGCLNFDVEALVNEDTLFRTHNVFWAAQTGKHLLRTQNVSEQNQKHFLCPGHKICVCNKRCARGKTFVSATMCRNNVSSFARAFTAVNYYFDGPCNIKMSRCYFFYRQPGKFGKESTLIKSEISA